MVFRVLTLRFRVDVLLRFKHAECYSNFEKLKTLAYSDSCFLCSFSQVSQHQSIQTRKTIRYFFLIICMVYTYGLIE